MVYLSNFRTNSNIKFMKKTFILLSFLFCLLSALPLQAQLQSIKLGAGVSYGTEIETLGINARGILGITEEIDVVPNVIFFFPNKEDFGFASNNFRFTWFELNADGHYNFELSGDASVYPLAGLNLAIVGYNYDGVNIPGYDESDVEIGLNFGGGILFNFTDAIRGFGELKYTTSWTGQIAISAGVIIPISE